MRHIIVRALWACADTLDIVRDGLIVLSSRVLVGKVEPITVAERIEPFLRP